jgi:hypothetical protein
MFPFLPFTTFVGFSVMVFVGAALYLLPVVVFSGVQKLRKREYPREVPFLPFMFASFVTLIAVWLALLFR